MLSEHKTKNALQECHLLAEFVKLLRIGALDNFRRLYQNEQYVGSAATKYIPEQMAQTSNLTQVDVNYFIIYVSGTEETA